MYTQPRFVIRNFLLLSVLLSLSLLVSAGAEGSSRAKRPMKIHQVSELGLEIWTEYEPEWPTDIHRKGKRTIFVAQTPLNTYPPAAMSWTTFPTMRIVEGNLKDVATSAIQTAAKNYKVSADNAAKIIPASATYSGLIGYEATFPGVAHGDNVDVKVFVGHLPGKPPVAMQVYTLTGKLPHLSEHIRRAWQNVKYLERTER